MITIKKMSQILGVSTTTVSNVIHGKTKEVSNETIEKVKALIEKYEYVPNINARNLAVNHSKIIGVAIRTMKEKYDNPINDPFVSELLGIIEKTIRSSGYFMMLYISDDISEILKCLNTWNVDGMVFLGISEEDFQMTREKYKKPSVYIDSYFYETISEVVNIGIDDMNGAYEMTKYLIENGHEKIGFFTDNYKGLDCERFKGYKKALSEFNIDFKEDNLIVVKPINGKIDYIVDYIYEISTKYTAFFCMSDYYAVNIMNYFMDKGKRVPEDFSIVGYDDIIYSQISRPTLTTVHQDIEQKGKIAIESLIKMIKGENLRAKKIILPTKLVIRNSVKNLNNTTIENK